jgi:copper ion binding protein
MTKKTIFNISGMTCGHCEKTIMNAVKKLDGVQSVTASFPKKRAEVAFDPAKSSESDIKSAIEREGYLVLSTGENKRQSVGKVLPVFLIIVALYFIAKYTVGFDFINLIPRIDSSVSLAALFVIGLFTSVHCIAM